MLPLQAVKVRVMVSAYHKHTRTATGGRPHRGICAAPRRWLGCYVKIKGMGSYKVADTCRHGIDIWLPTRKACKRWGRRIMTVRIEHPRKHVRVKKHRRLRR
jgi:3D (Asp-Asp-Asp) domain-containing protein